MDYSKFLDGGFDVKEWVNTAFRSNKEGTKEQHATTLVMKLQMFIQEVNNVIEESCQQAVNNLPRVMRELEAVKQEAALLQDQMNMVKCDIQKVEQDTAQSMQTLLKYDSIKSRMKAASEALQEADNWTTLSADVDEVFASGDVAAIAEKLVGLQQSLTILTDVPDYTERCQYLESLKNDLESKLSPKVVEAFSKQSLESAQMYVGIFSDIDRLSQLHKYYHTCHKTKLHQQWREIHERLQDEPLTFHLSQFYDHLLSTWYEQIQWCKQVFTNPVPIVCDLLHQTLSTMTPSVATLLDQYLQQASISKLHSLSEMKEMTDRFAKSLQTGLDSHTIGVGELLYIEKLASTVYAPYMIYVAQYGQYEQDILTSALNNIKLDHRDVLDSVNLLSQSVSKLFSSADQALDRCIKLTNGCGFIHLPHALQGYFGAYVREFKRVVDNIREKCRVENPSVDNYDWSNFQNALRIVQACGDMISHMEELDQSLMGSIVSTVEKFCPPPSPSHHGSDSKMTPFHDYKVLLLGSPTDRQALESLVMSLEEGEKTSLLETSIQEVYGLSSDIHRFAFDTVFAPLQYQLSQIPHMEIWQSESQAGAVTTSLPTFGLSPQEYITKLGQYLMTLPQQLDPFTMDDSPNLSIALRHGKLPYTSEQSDLPEHLADLWLDSVAHGTMHMYSEQILKIHQLSELATKQLIMDIEYLCNVLEDLGLPASDNLHHITSLLAASVPDYQVVAKDMPPRLASAIASIRKLPDS